MSAQSGCSAAGSARTLPKRVDNWRESMRTPAGLLVLLCGLLSGSLPAAAQQSDAIWACVDDQGHKVFQNVGSGRGCRRIDGLIATIPGTTPSAAAQSPSASGTRGVSPANFPRVD